MEHFKRSVGLRLEGEFTAVGPPDAVAAFDVVINGRKPWRVAANRISSRSFLEGGSFYGGVTLTVPISSFKGGMCVVQISDSDSQIPLGEFEFNSKDFVFEALLQTLDYGVVENDEDRFSDIQLTWNLQHILPDILANKKLSRAQTNQILSPVIRWIMQLIETGMQAQAAELLTAIDLKSVIRADAIGGVEIFIRLAKSANRKTLSRLQSYIANYSDLDGSATYNMMKMCVDTKIDKHEPPLDALKSQLKQWNFSSRAMLATFEFTETYIGRDAVVELKRWAMHEWIDATA